MVQSHALSSGTTLICKHTQQPSITYTYGLMTTAYTGSLYLMLTPKSKNFSVRPKHEVT